MTMPALITEKEAAALLRISRNKVKHHLPRIRLSAHGVRYDMADVRALIDSKKETNQWTH